MTPSPSPNGHPNGHAHLEPGAWRELVARQTPDPRADWDETSRENHRAAVDWWLDKEPDLNGAEE